MLDRLEKQGYLRRIPDPQDRRQIRIALTERARAMNERYQKVSAEMSEIFYSGFDQEEILQFEDTLRKILENLKQYEG